MTKDKKTLRDISTNERSELCKFIAENINNKKLIDLIYNKFGILYSKSNLRYVKKIALNADYINQMRKDNIIMDKWREEYKSDPSSDEDVMLNELYETAKVKGYLKE